MRRSLVFAVALCLVLSIGGTACAPRLSESDQVFASAFDDQRSGVQVTGSGTVSLVLPDDAEGDRHQRFIVELESGQTLLISHNIDIAPRVESLKTGDPVKFCGVYEWNDEGGVVHWAHHDPDGSHEPGWIDHAGLRHQ